MKELIEEMNKNILQLIQENKILQQQIQYGLLPKFSQQIESFRNCKCHCNCSQKFPLLPNYLVTNGKINNEKN